MGLFGGDSDDNTPSRGEQLAEEQINMNRQELENKRRNLYAERLDIIKSQGGQSWTPQRNSIAGKEGGNGKPNFNGEFGRFSGMPGVMIDSMRNRNNFQ